MNTVKIYTAQSNVSRFFTIDTITDLISRLSGFGDDVYYNNETKSIDINNPYTNNFTGNINDFIRTDLSHWIESLPAAKDDIKILTDNINVVFNITRISSHNFEDIIKVYLY